LQARTEEKTLAKDNFLLDDGGSPIDPTPTTNVKRTGGPPTDTTTFEDAVEVNGYFLCEKGGAVLFPYDDSPGADDFGKQLNDFIEDIQDKNESPFGDGTYGAGSVTIQLPWGVFVVMTQIEVPHGFFIQGFGAQFKGKPPGSFQYPGTTLHWKGSVNDWSGAPEYDQTPWKGFCVFFRGGTGSGLSHVRVECSAVDTPPVSPVTKGRNGVFVGTLNTDGPNAKGATSFVRLEYVDVCNADIGIQHGNVTYMDYNVEIKQFYHGYWRLRFGTNRDYQYHETGQPPETKEHIASDLVNMLNSGYPTSSDPKPVDTEDVLTWNHGANFDVVCRDSSKNIDSLVLLPLAVAPDQRHLYRTVHDLSAASTNKNTPLCEFHHCNISGAGSCGLLLYSSNADLSVVNSCTFTGADTWL